MIPVVAEHANELETLCRRYSVLRLDLFGSAATGAYRRGESDLDFVVEFLPTMTDIYSDTYFGLLTALEQLFEERVDLVVGSAITNPYFLQAVEETRTSIYAARDQEISF